MKGQERDKEIIVYKQFSDRAIAYLFKNMLKQEGINSFISNELASDMIALPQNGYTLHINKTDFESVDELNTLFEEDMQNRILEDYRDATHADIEYEKNLTELEKGRLPNAYTRIHIVFWIILLIMAIVAGFKYWE